MDISRAAMAALAAGCIVGGAAGAYFVSGAKPAVAPVAVASSPATRVLPRAPVAERRRALVPSAPRRADAADSSHASDRAAADIPAADAALTTAVENRPDLVSEAEAIDAPPIPPDPVFTELMIPAESVLGLEVETSLTSERAEVEDEVVARLTRDVRSGERVAIPAGSRAHGEVTLVERGGRLHERARLAVRFTSLVLPDGTRVPIDTDPVIREGDAPAGRSTAKIGGGAIGGAIIGGILGGARGAVIGGSVGAGAGTAAVLAGGRSVATLPSGTLVTVRLAKPAYVTLEP